MRNLLIVIQIIIFYLGINCNSGSKNESETSTKQEIVADQNNNTNNDKTSENKNTVNNDNENIEKKNEENNFDINNQEYNKLIVGSWYNYGTATGEDLYFFEDGTYSSRSGNFESSGNWKIEGEKLFVFDTEFKIIELSNEKLVIEDKYGQTTFDRI